MNAEARAIRGPRAEGFTLVEILTAMSLAVLVMIGLAQVFKITSDAVTEAESISDGYQSGRGAMNVLRRDLVRQVTGTLCIVPMEIPNSRTFGGTTTKYNRNNDKYRFDTLSFTGVGIFENLESNVGQSPQVAAGAEVLYTFAGRGVSGARVQPFDTVLHNANGTPVLDQDDDARTMLLVRRVFPFSSDPDMSGYSSPGLRIKDPVKNADSCLALMVADRWNESRAGFYSKFRLTPPSTMSSPDASQQPLVRVEPSYAGGYPVYDDTVNMIVCDRVSEFFVEIYALQTNRRYRWVLPSADTPYRVQNLWSGFCKNTMLVPSGRVPFAGYVMPRMIRVTLVVHPHNDTVPLRQESYAGDIPNTYPKKYRGMVFREVFRINGVTDPEK